MIYLVLHLKEKVIVKLQLRPTFSETFNEEKLFTERQNCLLPYTAPERLIKKLKMSASPLRHRTATLRETSATFLLRQTILSFTAIRAHTD